MGIFYPVTGGVKIMKITCLKCGHIEENAVGDSLIECTKCGAVHEKVRAAMSSEKVGNVISPARKKPLTEAKEQPIKSNILLFRVIAYVSLLFFVAVVLLGNFHIISGSTVGTKMVTKFSFGFSETFINTDMIGGMPWIAAKSQYPLSVKILQREGVFETDDARDQRIKSEVDSKSKEALKQYQESVDRIMRGSKY